MDSINFQVYSNIQKFHMYSRASGLGTSLLSDAKIVSSCGSRLVGWIGILMYVLKLCW